MCIATSPDLPINKDIMRKYVAGLTTLKTMMHMIYDELERAAQAVYHNAMEVKVRFQTDVTTEHTDTTETTELGISKLLLIIMRMLSSWTSIVV